MLGDQCGALVFGVLFATACAAGSETTGSTSTGGPGGAGGASSSSTTSSTGEGGLDPVGSGGSAPGCARGAELLYIVGFGANGSMLYTFDPPTLTFAPVGPLAGCPPGIFSQGGPYPVAMALDRNAIASVLYYDGGQQIVTDRLWRVDATTVTCTDTGQDMTHPAGPFTGAGLAYLPDPNDPMKDVLYASVQHGMGLQTVSEIGLVDPATLAVAPLGPTEATVKITGTGDGHLYGFGALALYEYDPATIAELSKKNVSVPVQSFPGNAFAFWGGQLWVFEATSSDPDTASTTAYLIDPVTGMASAEATVELYVTGAGVSTCAPIEPPL
jgi:hypothetical protein